MHEVTADGDFHVCSVETFKASEKILDISANIFKNIDSLARAPWLTTQQRRLAQICVCVHENIFASCALLETYPNGFESSQRNEVCFIIIRICAMTSTEILNLIVDCIFRYFLSVS